MTLELKSDAKEFKVALEEERLFVGKFDLLPPLKYGKGYVKLHVAHTLSWNTTIGIFFALLAIFHPPTFSVITT